MSEERYVLPPGTHYTGDSDTGGNPLIKLGSTGVIYRLPPGKTLLPDTGEVVYTAMFFNYPAVPSSRAPSQYTAAHALERRDAGHTLLGSQPGGYSHTLNYSALPGRPYGQGPSQGPFGGVFDQRSPASYSREFITTYNSLPSQFESGVYPPYGGYDQGQQSYYPPNSSTSMQRQLDPYTPLAYQPSPDALPYTHPNQPVADQSMYGFPPSPVNQWNSYPTMPETLGMTGKKGRAEDPMPADSGQGHTVGTTNERAASHKSGDVRQTIQCASCAGDASKKFCVIRQSKRSDGTTLAFCGNCKTVGMDPEEAALNCDAGPVLAKRGPVQRANAVKHTQKARIKKSKQNPPIPTPRCAPGDYRPILPAEGPWDNDLGYGRSGRK